MRWSKWDLNHNGLTKEISTPMHPTTSLGLEKESELVDNTLYR